ncbi:MAG: hypothetical protein ACLT29_03660 [Ruminococcus callidus]
MQRKSHRSFTLIWKAHSLTGWHGRWQYRCSSAAGAARLTGVTLPQEQLLQIAVKLGADVPFFLYGGTAYAAGIGEALEQLPACALPYLVIAKGNEGVSTPAAYRAVDALVCPSIRRCRSFVRR